MQPLNTPATRLIPKGGGAVVLRIEVGGRLLGLEFKHFKKPLTIKDKKGAPCKVFIDRQTICKLWEIKPLDEPDVEGESMVLLAEGVAECSVLDNYDKEKGRRVAIKRAICGHFMTKVKAFWADDPSKEIWKCKFCGIEHMKVKGNPHLSRAERGKIWNAYFDRPRQSGAEAKKNDTPTVP